MFYDYFFTTILFFFIVSLMNVILQTIKTVVTVKGNTLSAAIANAVTFGFYAFIVKLTANNPLVITVPLTIFTNFIGIFIAKYILQKFNKDKLWKVSCIVKRSTIDDFIIYDFLNKNKLEYYIYKAYKEYSFFYKIDILSYSQEQSKIIKDFVNEHNIKYTITEVEKSL